MSLQDEYDLITDRRKSQELLLTAAVAFVLVIILGCMISQSEKRPQLEPGDLAINQTMLDDLEHNLTIHIAKNYTGNVTIIKGDKVISWPSTSPIYEMRSYTRNITDGISCVDAATCRT